MHAHGEAVGKVARGQFQAVGAALEQRAGDLRRVVLEGEVVVAGGGSAQVADFTFNPEVAVVAFELGADVGV